MSIGKRVSETFAKLFAGDPEAAMFQICATIDETSKRESGRSDRASYKKFVFDNTDIICGVGLGVALSGLRMSYAHPKVDEGEDGTSSLQDIVYHAVRCSLYHNAALPATIRFTKGQFGPGADGVLQLPDLLVAGLAVAVILSPVNASERSAVDHFFVSMGTEYNVNEWWGRADDFRKQLSD